MCAFLKLVITETIHFLFYHFTFLSLPLSLTETYLFQSSELWKWSKKIPVPHEEAMKDDSDTLMLIICYMWN